jgi:hypothetical protein
MRAEQNRVWWAAWREACGHRPPSVRHPSESWDLAKVKHGASPREIPAFAGMTRRRRGRRGGGTSCVVSERRGAGSAQIMANPRRNQANRRPPYRDPFARLACRPRRHLQHHPSRHPSESWDLAKVERGACPKEIPTFAGRTRRRLVRPRMVVGAVGRGGQRERRGAIAKRPSYAVLASASAAATRSAASRSIWRNSASVCSIATRCCSSSSMRSRTRSDSARICSICWGSAS